MSKVLISEHNLRNYLFNLFKNQMKNKKNLFEGPPNTSTSSSHSQTSPSNSEYSQTFLNQIILNLKDNAKFDLGLNQFHHLLNSGFLKEGKIKLICNEKPITFNIHKNYINNFLSKYEQNKRKDASLNNVRFELLEYLINLINKSQENSLEISSKSVNNTHPIDAKKVNLYKFNSKNAVEFIKSYKSNFTYNQSETPYNEDVDQTDIYGSAPLSDRLQGAWDQFLNNIKNTGNFVDESHHNNQNAAAIKYFIDGVTGSVLEFSKDIVANKYADKMSSEELKACKDRADNFINKMKDATNYQKQFWILGQFLSTKEGALATRNYENSTLLNFFQNFVYGFGQGQFLGEDVRLATTGANISKDINPAFDNFFDIPTGLPKMYDSYKEILGLEAYLTNLQKDAKNNGDENYSSIKESYPLADYREQYSINNIEKNDVMKINVLFNIKEMNLLNYLQDELINNQKRSFRDVYNDNQIKNKLINLKNLKNINKLYYENNNIYLILPLQIYKSDNEKNDLIGNLDLKTINFEISAADIIFDKTGKHNKISYEIKNCISSDDIVKNKDKNNSYTILNLVIDRIKKYKIWTLDLNKPIDNFAGIGKQLKNPFNTATIDAMNDIIKNLPENEQEAALGQFELIKSQVQLQFNKISMLLNSGGDNLKNELLTKDIQKLYNDYAPAVIMKYIEYVNEQEKEKQKKVENLNSKKSQENNDNESETSSNFSFSDLFIKKLHAQEAENTKQNSSNLMQQMSTLKFNGVETRKLITYFNMKRKEAGEGNDFFEFETNQSFFNNIFGPDGEYPPTDSLSKAVITQNIIPRKEQGQESFTSVNSYLELGQLGSALGVLFAAGSWPYWVTAEVIFTAPSAINRWNMTSYINEKKEKLQSISSDLMSSVDTTRSNAIFNLDKIINDFKTYGINTPEYTALVKIKNDKTADETAKTAAQIDFINSIYRVLETQDSMENFFFLMDIFAMLPQMWTYTKAYGAWGLAKIRNRLTKANVDMQIIVRRPTSYKGNGQTITPEEYNKKSFWEKRKYEAADFEFVKKDMNAADYFLYTSNLPHLHIFSKNATDEILNFANADQMERIFGEGFLPLKDFIDNFYETVEYVGNAKVVTTQINPGQKISKQTYDLLDDAGKSKFTETESGYTFTQNSAESVRFNLNKNSKILKKDRSVIDPGNSHIKDEEIVESFSFEKYMSDIMALSKADVAAYQTAQKTAGVPVQIIDLMSAIKDLTKGTDKLETVFKMYLKLHGIEEDVIKVINIDDEFLNIINKIKRGQDYNDLEETEKEVIENFFKLYQGIIKKNDPQQFKEFISFIEKIQNKDDIYSFFIAKFQKELKNAKIKIPKRDDYVETPTYESPIDFEIKIGKFSRNKVYRKGDQLSIDELDNILQACDDNKIILKSDDAIKSITDFKKELNKTKKYPNKNTYELTDEVKIDDVVFKPNKTYDFYIVDQLLNKYNNINIDTIKDNFKFTLNNKELDIEYQNGIKFVNQEGYPIKDNADIDIKFTGSQDVTINNLSYAKGTQISRDVYKSLKKAKKLTDGKEEVLTPFQRYEKDMTKFITDYKTIHKSTELDAMMASLLALRTKSGGEAIYQNINNKKAKETAKSDDVKNLNAGNEIESTRKSLLILKKVMPQLKNNLLLDEDILQTLSMITKFIKSNELKMMQILESQYIASNATKYSDLYKEYFNNVLNIKVSSTQGADDAIKLKGEIEQQIQQKFGNKQLFKIGTTTKQKINTLNAKITELDSLEDASQKLGKTGARLMETIQIIPKVFADFSKGLDECHDILNKSVNELERSLNQQVTAHVTQSSDVRKFYILVKETTSKLTNIKTGLAKSALLAEKGLNITGKYVSNTGNFIENLSGSAYEITQVYTMPMAKIKNYFASFTKDSIGFFDFCLVQFKNLIHGIDDFFNSLTDLIADLKSNRVAVGDILKFDTWFLDNTTRTQKTFNIVNKVFDQIMGITSFIKSDKHPYLASVANVFIGMLNLLKATLIFRLKFPYLSNIISKVYNLQTLNENLKDSATIQKELSYFNAYGMPLIEHFISLSLSSAILNNNPTVLTQVKGLINGNINPFLANNLKILEIIKDRHTINLSQIKKQKVNEAIVNITSNINKTNGKNAASNTNSDDENQQKLKALTQLLSKNFLVINDLDSSKFQTDDNSLQKDYNEIKRFLEKSTFIKKISEQVTKQNAQTITNPFIENQMFAKFDNTYVFKNARSGDIFLKIFANKKAKENIDSQLISIPITKIINDATTTEKSKQLKKLEDADKQIQNKQTILDALRAIDFAALKVTKSLSSEKISFVFDADSYNAASDDVKNTFKSDIITMYQKSDKFFTLLSSRQFSRKKVNKRYNKNNANDKQIIDVGLGDEFNEISSDLFNNLYKDSNNDFTDSNLKTIADKYNNITRIKDKISFLDFSKKIKELSRNTKYQFDLFFLESIENVINCAKLEKEQNNFFNFNNNNFTIKFDDQNHSESFKLFQTICEKYNADFTKNYQDAIADYINDFKKNTKKGVNWVLNKIKDVMPGNFFEEKESINTEANQLIIPYFSKQIALLNDFLGQIKKQFSATCTDIDDLLTIISACILINNCKLTDDYFKTLKDKNLIDYDSYNIDSKEEDKALKNSNAASLIDTTTPSNNQNPSIVSSAFDVVSMLTNGISDFGNDEIVINNAYASNKNQNYFQLIDFNTFQTMVDSSVLSSYVAMKDDITDQVIQDIETINKFALDIRNVMSHVNSLYDDASNQLKNSKKSLNNTYEELNHTLQQITLQSEQDRLFKQFIKDFTSKNPNIDINAEDLKLKEKFEKWKEKINNNLEESFNKNKNRILKEDSERMKKIYSNLKDEQIENDELGDDNNGESVNSPFYNMLSNELLKSNSDYSMALMSFESKNKDYLKKCKESLRVNRNIKLSKVLDNFSVFYGVVNNLTEDLNFTFTANDQGVFNNEIIFGDNNHVDLDLLKTVSKKVVSLMSDKMSYLTEKTKIFNINNREEQNQNYSRLALVKNKLEQTNIGKNLLQNGIFNVTFLEGYKTLKNQHVNETKKFANILKDFEKEYEDNVNQKNAVDDKTLIEKAKRYIRVFRLMNNVVIKKVNDISIENKSKIDTNVNFDIKQLKDIDLKKIIKEYIVLLQNKVYHNLNHKSIVKEAIQYVKYLDYITEKLEEKTYIPKINENSFIIGFDYDENILKVSSQKEEVARINSLIILTLSHEDTRLQIPSDIDNNDFRNQLLLKVPFVYRVDISEIYNLSPDISLKFETTHIDKKLSDETDLLNIGFESFQIVNDTVSISENQTTSQKTLQEIFIASNIASNNPESLNLLFKNNS